MEEVMMNEQHPDFERRLEQVKNLATIAARNLERVHDLIQKLEEDKQIEKYKGMPGIAGTFDGQYLVGEDGNKYEVPANYAAKSRLVFGDTLKMVEEDEKKLFKQVEKVERKRVDGIVSKKEGRWYVLCDSGSYRISDIAATFNGVEVNDEVKIIIPAQNLSAPFAALDRVLTDKKGNKEYVADIVSEGSKRKEKRIVTKAPVKIVKEETKKEEPKREEKKVVKKEVKLEADDLR